METKSNKSIFAVLLIIFGIILILKNFNIPILQNLNFGSFIGLIWPLFIIRPGIESLINKKYISAFILILIGGTFFVDNFLGIFNISFNSFKMFSLIWPGLLIFAGISLIRPNSNILNASFSKSNKEDSFSYDTDEEIYTSTEDVKLISKTINFNSKKYKFEYDDMEDGVTKLELNISFGGADIIVEEGIQVIFLGQYFLSGYNFFDAQNGALSSKFSLTRYEMSEDKMFKKILMINANVTFGGIEISTR